MTERFPRQFGKYVLLKSLARGGMGEIYLAASDRAGGLSKLCVIKKVIPEKTDRAKVNRFLDEAKVVLRLSHANLVSTFDAGDVKGELYIAMELVEGKDLREIWNRCVRTRTRIPLDVALYVVRETARALAYVHTYGDLRLVHRDVAPPNILLSYYGEVKLTDFGLARSALKQEHTAPGVVFGRASYLAPEQARGEVADGRTDVYSLGIILWEFLTGQPYLQLAGLDPVTSLSLVRNPKPQPPSAKAPWIVPELDVLALKALAADRSTRFQSAEEMRRAMSDAMTRVAPRADAERVAEFLRGLYRDVVIEEAAERERLLGDTLPRFRGEHIDAATTPRTDVLPAGGPQGAGMGNNGAGASVAAAAVVVVGGAAAAAEPVDADAPVASRRRATSPGAARSPTPTPSPSPVPSPTERTVVARVSEVLSESLHASAMRARAGSHQRRRAEEISGTDAATTIWRKGKPPSAENDAAATFVGRVIDNRYRIRRRIGEGGMGTVYAAEHVEIGKGVAVKILHREFSGEQQLVERFRREARAASRVGHPHIVDVTDFGTTEDGCAYFVMEQLEGMDLADVLAHEERLEPARAVRIAVQICQALRAAHTAGIIHRDLKPENIFLVPRDGQADFVKVLDFGIARNLAGEAWRLTNPGMTMGTPEYMAPEQALGRPADARTDIYALGALLYEMLLGAPPFRATSPDAMLEQKMRPLPSLRDERAEISPALDTAVAQTMSPDPDRRHQTMAELEYELTKIVAGRPVAVAELLGLREVAEAHLETPAAAAPPPAPAPSPALPFEATPPPPARVSVPMRVAELEAFLEADVSPPPVAVANGSAPAPGRRGAGVATTLVLPGPAAPAPITAVAAVATTRAGGAPWYRGGAAPGAAVPALPAPPDAPVATLRPRGPTAAVVTLVLLGGVGASAAWISTHGAPDLLKQFMSLPSAANPVAPTGPRAAPPRPSRVAPPLPEVRPSPSPRSSVVASAPFAPAALAPAGSAPSASGSPPARPARAAPEIVPTPPLERARTALGAGAPDDAVAVLRPALGGGDPAVRGLLADALVASGWKAVPTYHWNVVAHRAREALAIVDPAGPSHGAHALLGEALYAERDFTAALDQFTRALAESPRDARLKRRVIRSRRELHRPEDGRDGAPPSPASAPAEPAPQQ